jgi:hypothetical protein
MKTSDFEKELKTLDPRLAIVPNPNRAGLSNIKLDGRDVCPVPTDDIREEQDPNYTYSFPNGMIAPHNSRTAALDKVHHVLNYIKTEEGREVFFS